MHDPRQPSAASKLRAKLSSASTRCGKSGRPSTYGMPEDSPRCKPTLARVEFLIRPELEMRPRERPKDSEVGLDLFTNGAELLQRAGKLNGLTSPVVDDTTEAAGLIADTAKTVRQILGESNAAERFILAGTRLKLLHVELRKLNCADREHAGWQKAFDGDAFPFTRRVAESLIKIAERFGAWNAHPIAHLPTSWRSLYILANKFTDAQIVEHIATSRISPLATIRDIAVLGRELGVLAKQARNDDLVLKIPRQLLTAGRGVRVEAVMHALSRLRLRPGDLPTLSPSPSRFRTNNIHELHSA
jgi:hypothetical protein